MRSFCPWSVVVLYCTDEKYFALSGLKTNIGLLNTGIVWAYTIGIILVALFSKIVGSSLMARLNGLVWRESFTVGVLMSCKG